MTRNQIINKVRKIVAPHIPIEYFRLFILFYTPAQYDFVPELRAAGIAKWRIHQMQDETGTMVTIYTHGRDDDLTRTEN